MFDFPRRDSWCLVALCFAMLGCRETAPPAVEPKTGDPAKAIELVIDLGEGAKKSYHVQWEPDLTVLAAMERAAKTSGLEFRHRHSGEMAFLDAIGSTRNETARNGRSWIYHVNGEQADVGFGARKLKPGDVVLWRFQTYNP
jgi:hypothetical protein